MIMFHNVTNRRLATGLLLAALLVVSAAPYLRGGIARAYFAADDFQWLAGGHTLKWSRMSQVSSREHFYRPMADAWFAASVAGCGAASACYHLATLAVHLLNVALVFLLALALLRDLRVAFLGTLLFALEPAYVQAVVWISAITGVMATTFYLASLLVQVRSWTAETHRHRTLYELLAVVLFAGALFAHEAAATLPAIAWIMWRQFGPADLIRRPILVSGSALVLAAFAVTTVIANRRNDVFTGGHYAFGLHAIRHAFDYFVALYVGPGWWLAYTACAIGIALLLIATPGTRFGALWLLGTLVPYVWFTAENVSRYLYLPSIGFGIAVAGAVVALCDVLVNRFELPIVGRVVFVLAIAFVAVRFGRFCGVAAQSQVANMEYWRTYASKLAADASMGAGDTVRVRAPSDEIVQPMYVEPMLQWVHQNYRLKVVDP